MANELREKPGHRQEDDVNSPLLEFPVNLKVAQRLAKLLRVLDYDANNNRIVFNRCTLPFLI